MGCVTKTLGRLLFVTFLISTAYLHLTKHQDYTEAFANNYEEFTKCTGKYLEGIYTLPSAQSINWNLWVQVYAAFYGAIALLIVIGDGLGGWLLFLSLQISGMFRYCQIASFLQWQVLKQLQFAQYLTLLGASLVLAQCCKSKSSCGSSCGKKPQQQIKQSSNESIKDSSKPQKQGNKPKKN